MYLDLLAEALKNKYDTEFRDGVHVSDLTLCPRKSVERRLNRRPITNKELNFFTSGRAIHDAIQNLARAGGDDKRFEVEKEVEQGGISGHIDLYDTMHNVLIECKSMRVKEVKEPKPHHVEQLKAYMAMTKSPVGVILYQALLHFEDEPFKEFEITMGEDEAAAKMESLFRDKALFAEAEKQKNPMIARGVFRDTGLNWLCRDCPMKAKCEQEASA